MAAISVIDRPPCANHAAVVRANPLRADPRKHQAVELRRHPEVRVVGVVIEGVRVGPAQAFGICLQGVTQARVRRVDTHAGVVSALYVGTVALKLKLGPNMPIVTSADTALTTASATTKWSTVAYDSTKQADGGAGSPAAIWVANGTT